MISFILILKAILACWLFIKSFRFLGTFLAVHALIDFCNLFQKSYYIATISFVLVPHILIACLSEIRNLRYLRYMNTISFVLLVIDIEYGYALTNIMNYFLLYSITILLSTWTFKRKEDLLLSIALLLQILEIILYKFFAANYIVINLINIIYYTIIITHLISNKNISPTNNTPILDDCSATKNKEKNIVSTNEFSDEIHKKKVA